MPSFAAAARAWPDPLRFAPRFVLALALALCAATLWGKEFIVLLLPYVRAALPWLDDSFAITSLGLHQAQDTVIALRVTLAKAVFINGHFTFTDPRGWLEVTTTAGTMLQPMVIALGIAAAWPKTVFSTLIACVLALLGTLLLLLADLPLTLYAYVWDMFHFHYDPDGFSPLVAWHQFMLSGGRLGLGLVIGAIACALGCTHTPRFRHESKSTGKKMRWKL
ncbi:MAG: hypothetical protein ACKVQA_16800 [Burkholderiales bacterium]